MRRKWLHLAAAIFVATQAVATPAPPEQNSLLFLQELDQRIADVSWRLLATNAALCPDRMSAVGLSLHDAAQYAPAYRQAAVSTFGFGDGLPTVLAVAKGGPADAAGFNAGDRIVGLDGQAMTAARIADKAKADYATIDAAMGLLEKLPPDRPTRVDVLRGQERLTLMIRPTMICRSRVEVVPSGQINANSNGFVVQIYGKLALWTKTDDELAMVIGHEISHNILSHNRRIDREKIGTGVFASLGRDGRKLRDMEREADRYGLFMVARAGYDYRQAPDFWRRLSATAGLGGIWATTHPSAGNRAEFNRRVVAEIDAQKAAGADPSP